MILLEKIETPEQMVRELEQNNCVVLLDQNTKTIGFLFDIHRINPADLEYRTRFGILWRKSREHRVDLRQRLREYAQELLDRQDGIVPFLLTFKITNDERKADGRAVEAAKKLLEGRSR